MKNEMKKEMINSIERVISKMSNEVKEAKFELLKPKNLVCEYNYIVSDLAGIYTVDTSDLDKYNNKHYILKDNSPSFIARFKKSTTNHIIETYKEEQNINLRVVEYKTFYKERLETLEKCIKSNKDLIKTLS